MKMKTSDGNYNKGKNSVGTMMLKSISTFWLGTMLISIQLTMIINTDFASADTQLPPSSKVNHHRLVNIKDLDEDLDQIIMEGQRERQGQDQNKGSRMSMSMPMPLILPRLPMSIPNPNLRLSPSRSFGSGYRLENGNERVREMRELDLFPEPGSVPMPVPVPEPSVVDLERVLPEVPAEELPLPVTKLSQRQLVALLMERFKTKTQHEPRMVLEQMSENEIKHLCAQSASLTCGKDVLANVEDRGDTHDKCNMRKDFLDCVTDSREECNELARVNIFPPLPPQNEIADFQKRVWRALWTSGGCVLAV